MKSVFLFAAVTCAFLGLMSHTNGETNAWMVASLAWYTCWFKTLARIRKGPRYPL
jgi:hypothetical protein